MAVPPATVVDMRPPRAAKSKKTSERPFHAAGSDLRYERTSNAWQGFLRRDHKNHFYDAGDAAAGQTAPGARKTHGWPEGGTMWDYTDKVREYFLHPRNAGELKDANAVGEVGSLACGDALKLFLKINDAGVIEDASFQTFGCASAIASSSVLTELIKGKTVEEASKITNKEIAEQLGGLPREKMHCSVMGQEALEAALRAWRGEPAVPHCHEGALVCKCFGVTDTQIRRAIQENHLKTVEEITDYTKAGGGCGGCIDEIQRILDEELGKPRLQELTPKTKALTNVQRMQKIMHVLEDEIKPRLAADGGDIELVDVVGQKVVVSFSGKCSGCRTRKVTIRDLVEKQLREQVEPELVVEEA